MSEKPNSDTGRIRRRWVIAASLVAVVLLGAVIGIVATSRDLKFRSAAISVGMHRKEVERLLGQPILDMNRTGGRGDLLVWVDQLWQLDVLLGPDARVQAVSYAPSDSFFRRTSARIKSLLK